MDAQEKKLFKAMGIPKEFLSRGKKRFSITDIVMATEIRYRGILMEMLKETARLDTEKAINTPEEWRGYTSEIACEAPGMPETGAAIVFRVIYNPSQKFPLEFVPGRGGQRGTPTDVGHLLMWISHVMPLIQSACHAVNLGQMDSTWFCYEDDSGVFKGTPNGSGGYMYAAAWLKRKP